MPPDPSRIIDLANAFYESCVLFAASDLGVFGELAELESADAERIANELATDTRSTRLLLDACVAIGLLEKEGDVYHNSPESSAFLVPNVPGNLTGAIRYNRDVYPAWGNLPELVHTGKPVERPEIHLGEDENRTRTFVLSMHQRAMGIGRAVVPLLDLRDRRQLLDIGGGPGTYSVLLAKAFPALSCTVMDLPEIVQIAEELIAEEGVDDRVKTRAGDYHTTEFPQGNDVVNIFGVLHQESPNTIQDILNRSFNSLTPGGVINIMDMMTGASHTAPKFSALFAVNMALTTEDGWVFSDRELSGWLSTAGFTDIEIEPLPPPMPHWLATACRT